MNNNISYNRCLFRFYYFFLGYLFVLIKALFTISRNLLFFSVWFDPEEKTENMFYVIFFFLMTSGFIAVIFFVIIIIAISIIIIIIISVIIITIAISVFAVIVIIISVLTFPYTFLGDWKFIWRDGRRWLFPQLQILFWHLRTSISHKEYNYKKKTWVHYFFRPTNTSSCNNKINKQNLDKTEENVWPGTRHTVNCSPSHSGCSLNGYPGTCGAWTEVSGMLHGLSPAVIGSCPSRAQAWTQRRARVRPSL